MSTRINIYGCFVSKVVSGNWKLKTKEISLQRGQVDSACECREYQWAGVKGLLLGMIN